MALKINSIKWLPTSRKEMEALGWEYVDVILFTGDAYVDHPSFGAAVIGRTLESIGLRVAIVPQPNWRDDLRDFKKLGSPRLFFGITAGNMDSMVNHYTANIRLRSDDAYTPEGKAGFRPDYALTVYSQIVKKLFPDVPVIIGGIEASLRRLTHFDYWSNSLKPSILADTNADLLVYGMGEKVIKEIALKLMNGEPFTDLYDLPQTAHIIDNPINEISFKLRSVEHPENIEIPSHEECLKSKEKFGLSFKLAEEESNKISSHRIYQKVGGKYVVVNPPYAHNTQEEIDEMYSYPYTYLPHPRYSGKKIPAYEMIKHSVNIHRGCFGGCSFCTISMHQGKHIVSRSENSILKEIDKITDLDDFKGHISDLGGPSANMYKMHGKDLKICEKCRKPSCIYPEICKNLDTNHQPLIDLYRKVRNHSKIKKVTIGSGIRYDMFLDPETKHKSHELYMQELIQYHVSGRLKVAPEHSSDNVLKMMRKPAFSYFKKFKNIFDKLNNKFGLNQQLIPYFISSHPGSGTVEMAELAADTKEMGYKLEQIQDFTPTPMTLSSVVFYTGIDPYTQKKVYTPHSQDDKKKQRAFFFWYNKENHQLIKNELKKIKRLDLLSKLGIR